MKPAMVGSVAVALAIAVATLAQVMADPVARDRPGVSHTRAVEQPVTPRKPTDVLRIDRIRFDPHLSIEPHAHPVPTLVYVLSGTALLQMECSGSRTVKPGDTFYMPPGTPIVKLNTGEQPLEFIAIFLRATGDIDDGDPRMTIMYPKATATTDRDGKPCAKP